MEKMIIQYWNDSLPPSDVQKIITGWAEINPSWKHCLYNDYSARNLLVQNFEETVVSAYDKCRFPQMRSDIFRLAALYISGGVYVDAGIKCIVKLDEWISPWLEKSNPIFVRKWHGKLMNGFIIAQPKSELIQGVLRLAVSNVLSKKSHNIYDVTGPGVLNKVVESANFEFEEMEFQYFRQHVRMGNDLSYKMCGNHWSEQQKITGIYFD